MRSAFHAAVFSVMALSASCGVGAQAQAQDLDTRIGKIAMEGELPSHESIPRLYAEQAARSLRLYAPTEAYFDKSWKLDDIALME
jgi:hypothetical protein